MKKKTTTKKRIRKAPKVVTKVVVKEPPTETPEDPTHRIIMNKIKEGITAWLCSEQDEIWAMGSIHSAIELAEKLKIPKQSISVEITLAELLEMKKKFEKKEKEASNIEAD